ncbi:2-keto-4-pentenoate hydratase [Streptomyces sp. MMBL 11-3]|uniref:2-keto-4-pentenoate hydratase n=1 Tax=Streptomyces sp. MMBL 11-3 TaxID=3382639 RepID=UPI0039B527CF
MTITERPEPALPPGTPAPGPGPGGWSPVLGALHVFTSPGRLEEGWLTEAAAHLAAAECSRRPARRLTERHPQMTLAQAYRIQWTIIQDRVLRGARVAGHKVGLTSSAMQQQMGVDQPDSGILLQDMLLPTASSLHLDDFVLPRIETEIAFRLGADLHGPDVDAAAARAAVSEVLLALEVIDTRYGQWQITVEDSVADNASAARAVLGPAVPLTRPLALDAEEVHVSVNGIPAAVACGAAVLGDPLNAVAWLARRLSEYGAHLHAGDLILPGSVHASLPLQAGMEVEARAPHLPPVRAQVT